MLLYLFLLSALLASPIQGVNITENASQNKTKRTIGSQVQNHGENKAIIVYVDNLAAQTANNQQDPQNFYASTKPFAFTGTPVKAFLGSAVPKVAAQQVLYEFQQTPTNAVSNVHVKQLFQPPVEGDNTQEYPTNPPLGRPETNSNQFSASETVVSPIQHSAYTNHGQNYAHINFHPLYNIPQHNIQSQHNIQPHHVQTQQHYVPGKYLYVNGKFVYQPNNNLNNQQGANAPALPQNNPHQHQAYNHNQQKLPLLNYGRLPLQQKLVPPPITPPASYSRFNPPQKHQIQPITNPMTPAPPPAEVEEQNDEEEESAPQQENEEEVEENENSDDEKSNYQEAEAEEEEEDDRQNYDRNPVFGKYTFDEDEERENHQGYRDGGEEEVEEEEDEDSRRGSSRHVSSKARKSPKKKASGKPGKYNKNDSYSYSEGYSTSSKFEHPGKKKKKSLKVPSKTHYKSAKYSKGSKPRIEGRYSENVPVTHKHKVIKEKWYLTKRTDDKLEMSSEDV